jgi:preprotein translocase subunit SecA
MSSAEAPSLLATGLYPEREEPRLGKVDRFAATMGGVFAPWVRPRADRFRWIIEAVHSHAAHLSGLSDKDLLEHSRNLRPRLRLEGFRPELVSQVFALVREASGRTLGTPHYDSQLIGGLVLLKGMIAEMETGEGKTLTATLAASAVALAGGAVHIITVNDYLAQRDASWMAPIFQSLGLSVGVIHHGMQPEAKKQAYRADITYCTNKEVAFDYLRDRIVLWERPTPVRLRVERLFGKNSRVSRLLLRGLQFAIVDEADSVLIDEARTPLIISAEGEGGHPPGVYKQAIEIARNLARKEEYSLSESEHHAELTKRGKDRVNAYDWMEVGLRASDEQKEELVRQALSALHLYQKDKQYLVKDGKIQIIDEYTGRLMADRSWERGLHQLIELKEGCEVTVRKETKARISYQRFFRRYLGLSGMTGTASEVGSELWSIYRLRVVTIPPNRAVIRRILPDRVFRSADEKWTAVVKRVIDLHAHDLPVLVGTRSVEASETVSGMMEEAGLPYRVLNARQDKEEAAIISEAGKARNITVATNMAGRGTDIRLDADVVNMGGLYVIATERHDSRRIDRQLFGRCARQGDPGTCEAFVSLEDELLTTYLGRFLQRIATVGLLISENLLGPWIGGILLREAQRKAERLHARARHDLLKMDEQMSDSLAFSGRLE